MDRHRATALILTILDWAVAALLLLLPLALLFGAALRDGLGAALEALRDPDALAAIRLSAIVVAIAGPINTGCGLFAAYALTRFDFPLRGLLLGLIELPLSVSPVVSGLVWVLLFGAHGWFGPMLANANIDIMFALPAILLATLFVTFPYVVRTVMPVLDTQGRDNEEAATMLGARLGNVLLRAGHIPGLTETVPLRIETLYNDYQSVAAFALAALLAITSGLTVGLRGVLEWRHGGIGVTSRNTTRMVA